MKKFLSLFSVIALLIFVGCASPNPGTVLVKGPAMINFGFGIPGTTLVILNNTDERVIVSVDGQDRAVLEAGAKTTFEMKVIGRDSQCWTIILQGQSGSYVQQVSSYYQA